MDMRAFSAENLARCTAPNGFNHPLSSWTLSDWMTATLGELGEAANVLKKLNRVRDGIPGNSETPEQLKQMFADELADTYIYLDLLAQAADTDLMHSTSLTVIAPDDDWTLSDWMTMTLGSLGMAAMLVIDRVPRDTLQMRLRDTYDYLNMLCQKAGVDLPSAVRTKFDRTKRWTKSRRKDLPKAMRNHRRG